LCLAITGLDMGETIRDIDYRASDGPTPTRLYGFGSAGNIYTIDATSAVATKVAGLTTAMGAPVTVTNNNLGIDFNPVPDLLRIVNGAAQNLRVNVGTGGVTPGTTTVDGMLTTTAPATVTATGYTNNFAGTTSTVLYQIDTGSGTLEVQAPPNDGVLTQRKRLDPVLTFTKVAGFDIQGADQSDTVFGLTAPSTAGPLSLAVLQPTGAMQSTLYRVNLAPTGFALTPIGPIGPTATPVLINAFAIRLQ
jgi:hypothetical protein